MCPVLRRTVVQGCYILNADPTVFAIILDYLESQRVLQRLRRNTFQRSAQNPLERLAAGGDPMLKLAKAWHIADMLLLRPLQNKLVGMYRVIYLEHLKSRTQVRLEPELFEYLKDYMGMHTMIEKFIIDFHAGLVRLEGVFSAEALKPLPSDIATSLKRRRDHLVAMGPDADLIAKDSDEFIITGKEATQRHPLQVIKPSALQPSSSSNDDITAQPRRGSGFSFSSIASLFSSLRSSSLPSNELVVPSSPPRRVHRRGVSLPTNLASLSGRADAMVSRALRPSLGSPQATVIRRPRVTRSTTMITILPSRAPFMPRPTLRRRAMTMPDDDSSGSEVEYGLFPARLRPLHDLAREDGLEMRSLHDLASEVEAGEDEATEDVAREDESGACTGS
ncbi:hypothetical protein GMOD_00007489 [Pyrenophora seminiperda CCB06]|uniref:Uncharacterized protein n=1 Tax=Pyrenophora seminiperda CCB06 TaxID=1302712 RepID=A0A3M7MDC2_9PLEO|nr:hypothetical protein GMOD_00007489 [Pyrenophora seminiperda CCB06]